jgi:uncharacterized protein YjbJ (UPF0337 family)
MDKHWIKGNIRQVRGAVKELAGKATGDRKLRAQGRVEKARGKVEIGVARVKSAIRNLVSR